MSKESPRKLTMADYYPTGMSACDRNGLNGDCGPECEVFLDGECSIAEEIRDEVFPMDGNQYLLFRNERP